MRDIHPTAIVDRKAELADDVVVGAFTIIKPGVVIGAGTVVQEQCHIHGNTTIGRRCKIGPAAFVGLPPQHLKHDGNGTRCFIGDDVIIRELASIHRSINPADGHATRIGSRCMIMSSTHVGHDCLVGEEVLIATGAGIAGHVVLGDKVFVGGGAMIHQFVRVGRLTIISGNEPISNDAPPFSAVRYRGLKGYNAIGCKRAGMSRDVIHAIRAAYHCLHINRTIPAAVMEIRRTIPLFPEIEELLDFIATSKRGILPSVRGKGVIRFSRTEAGEQDEEDSSSGGRD